MICSWTLLVTDVSETGLQFSVRCLSPFLKIGATFAVSQSSGRVPVLTDFWNMSVSPAKCVEHSLRTWLCMLEPVVYVVGTGCFCWVYIP